MQDDEIEFIQKYTSTVVHNRLRNASILMGNRIVARTSHTSDIVQDLMLKISNGIDRWDDLKYSDKKKIIAQAAHFATVDFIRKQSRIARIRSNQSNDSLDTIDTSPDEHLSFESIEILEAIFDESDLEIFVLIIAGFTYIEVANIVDRPLSQVRKVIECARKQLTLDDIADY